MWKKIFNLAAIIILLLAVCFSCNNKSTERDLHRAATSVVKAFSEKDTAAIRQFIHPVFGLIILHKQGIFPAFSVFGNNAEKTPETEHLLFREMPEISGLRFEELPGFDCNNMMWSKTGFYCDTTRTDHLLTETLQTIREFGTGIIPDEQFEKYRKIEMQSVRFVLCDNNGKDFVFSLTLFNGRWYLTLLDRLSSDCSA